MHSLHITFKSKQYSSIRRLLFTRASTSGRCHLLQLCWGYVKQQANILSWTAETALSCRTMLSYGLATNSCEHKFLWSGALTSRSLWQEVMLSQCHQLVMFQAPEPIMKTTIIMVCSYADFRQSLAKWGLWGCQSVFPLLNHTPGKHWVTQTSIPLPAVWDHLPVLHFCPLSFNCIY